MATVAVKGYNVALTGPTADEDAALLTSELNLKAYNDLLLSCQDEITFGLIDEATGEEFSSGGLETFEEQV